MRGATDSRSCLAGSSPSNKRLKLTKREGSCRFRLRTSIVTRAIVMGGLTILGILMSVAGASLPRQGRLGQMRVQQGVAADEAPSPRRKDSAGVPRLERGAQWAFRS